MANLQVMMLDSADVQEEVQVGSEPPPKKEEGSLYNKEVVALCRKEVVALCPQNTWVCYVVIMMLD